MLSMAFIDCLLVICSALYLLYNGLLTNMLVADELNDFIKERYPECGPGTELDVLTSTSGCKENHRELRIDLGPALEVPNQSQEVSPHDGASIGEQRGESDDTPAPLSRSQIGA